MSAGEIIDRCLSTSPAARFASVDELCAALERTGGTPASGAATIRFLACDHLTSPTAAFLPAPARSANFTPGCATKRCCSLGIRGVGKSSLCRAGVAASVLAFGMGDGRQYQLVEFAPGHTPGRALCDALSPLLNQPASELYATLRSDPGTLARGLQRHPGDTRRCPLLIDPLEELCTQSDPAEAELLSEFLGLLSVKAPGLRVLLCARGDFLTRLSALPGLGD